MARRRSVAVMAIVPGVEPEEKPEGSLLFADPAKAGFTSDIHTFNEPHSNAMGEQRGFRSLTGRLTPWDDFTGARTGEGAWAHMNRRRGVSDDKE